MKLMISTPSRITGEAYRVNLSLVVVGAVTNPAVTQLGAVLVVILLSPTALASPVVGVESHFLNQPKVRGTGGHGRGINCYCHN